MCHLVSAGVGLDQHRSDHRFLGVMAEGVVEDSSHSGVSGNDPQTDCRDHGEEQQQGLHYYVQVDGPPLRCRRGNSGFRLAQMNSALGLRAFSLYPR
jgi:hypothetical protein